MNTMDSLTQTALGAVIGDIGLEKKYGKKSTPYWCRIWHTPRFRCNTKSIHRSSESIRLASKLQPFHLFSL